ncbi:glycosyltransferase [Polynucleobacter sp. AP-Jannik-300A-C4]|nr:glycosyltransferase [Polynucleobacter sp. AP-Jannik-300A-C4]
MHDTAIAIVDPCGKIIYAASLERYTRVKQDGRPPTLFLQNFPWERVKYVAISTDRDFSPPSPSDSTLLDCSLVQSRVGGLLHAFEFYEFLESIPVEKRFVPHQIAHAASAFWGSGFKSALCLTYDGGMCNSPWFGGLYLCDQVDGITPLSQFNALSYSKITTLYTFVTALLGFTPNKHEGKVTGLAACGTSTISCRRLLEKWFHSEFISIESTLEWINIYDLVHPPALAVFEAKMQPFRVASQEFSKEIIAATLQEMTEEHVIKILTRAADNGWMRNHICLAGGLFANVKINQRISEFGFEEIFVAPPMADDGTALGAAWHALWQESGCPPPRMDSMYLGSRYDPALTEQLLVGEGICFERLSNPADYIANLLSKEGVVAIFQGAMEFGPRSLGNRSILASATKSDVNKSLNNLLNRTDFMPFAPVSRIEDAEDCYVGIEGVLHTAEFMTITLQCTEWMKRDCPAVVHVDGTARPQLVSSDVNPLIHAILSKYIELTGVPALVNTSFNIHEEPIVCSPKDAIQGFFEAGLDYLYLEGGFLIDLKNNMEVSNKYLRKKLRQKPHKLLQQEAIVIRQSTRLAEQEVQLAEKELVIKELDDEIKKIRTKLAEQNSVLRLHRMAYGSYNPLAPLARICRRCYEIFRPRLGNLSQYSPRHFIITEKKYHYPEMVMPTISLVTPSYNQGEYIERTINSVLRQNYPALEYFIQDGASKDATVRVVQKFLDKISGWKSAEDTGQSEAINLGFSQTSGEIMAWLNSDDLLLPGALHTVAHYFNSHPEVDVVYGNRILIDENDMKVGRWVMPSHDDSILSWVDFIPQETLFWRRSVWEKIGGGVDESFKFAMDWDLILRFRDVGAKFARIPIFLGAFRVHQHQKTSVSIDDIGSKEMARIRQRALGRVPTQGEIRNAVKLYLIKHVVTDLLYRIKKLLGINEKITF